MRRKTEEVDMKIDFEAEEMKVETEDEILDHMLETFFFYMGEEVEIEAEWDLRHHLWEDMGILLGKAFKRKIEDKNIRRFGDSIMPMDDALMLVSVDISRQYLKTDFDLGRTEEGFDLEIVEEFLSGLVRNLSATIHVKQLEGKNSHHVIEAAFKGLGVSFSEALKSAEEVKSTKGSL